jgi:hypothetical protein
MVNPVVISEICNSVFFTAMATNINKIKLRGFSLQADVAWSVQQIPTAINLDFLDRSRYFSIQVAPQLSSRG